MAWQTSPESRFSHQQGFRATEQTSTQGPEPALPRIPGFSEQALTSVPSSVLHTAEAAGLGTPTREYNIGEFPGKSLLAALLTSLDFWLILLALCVLLILLPILLTTRFPLNLLIPGLILAALLPFIPPILKGRTAFNSRERRLFRAWRCPGGLVYTQDEQFCAVRWEHIEVVVRKTAVVNDVVSTIGYLVQPNGPLPFGFLLLRKPAADSLKRASTSRSTLTLSLSSSGQILVADTTQFIGNFDLLAYAGLGELIEEKVVSSHLPRVLETYQSGLAIAFGPLTISQQGLSTSYEDEGEDEDESEDGDQEESEGEEKLLPWNEFAAVQVSASAIQITKRPDNDIWCDLPLEEVPNAALLLTFLHALRGEGTEDLAR